MKSNHSKGWMHALTFGIVLAVAASTGCQVSSSGQTLPSPYYIRDDVQYFPAKAEFKLSEEANMMKAYNANREAQTR